MSAATWQVLAKDLRFPEGPIAMPDGSVVLVEIRGGDLTRVLPDGTTETVAHLGGGPNGAAVGPDGAFYICNNGGYAWGEVHGLFIPVGTAEPDTRRLHPARRSGHRRGGRAVRQLRRGAAELAERHRVRHRRRLLVHRPRPPARPLARRRRGVLRGGRRVVDPRSDLPASTIPNGIGLSPDGTALYVADSVHARMWQWDLERAGCDRRRRRSVRAPERVAALRVRRARVARLARRRLERRGVRRHVDQRRHHRDRARRNARRRSCPCRSTTPRSRTSASAATTYAPPTSPHPASASCTPPSGRVRVPRSRS